MPKKATSTADKYYGYFKVEKWPENLDEAFANYYLKKSKSYTN
jgi:hypothetical protein